MLRVQRPLSGMMRSPQCVKRTIGVMKESNGDKVKDSRLLPKVRERPVSDLGEGKQGTVKNLQRTRVGEQPRQLPLAVDTQVGSCWELAAPKICSGHRVQLNAFQGTFDYRVLSIIGTHCPPFGIGVHLCLPRLRSNPLRRRSPHQLRRCRQNLVPHRFRYASPPPPHRHCSVQLLGLCPRPRSSRRAA